MYINERVEKLILADFKRSIIKYYSHSVNEAFYKFDGHSVGRKDDLKEHLYVYLRQVYGMNSYLDRQSWIEKNWLNIIGG
jgi:hypothetical protein